MLLRKWAIVAVCVMAVAGTAHAQDQGQSPQGTGEQQTPKPKEAEPPQSPVDQPPASDQSLPAANGVPPALSINSAAPSGSLSGEKTDGAKVSNPQQAEPRGNDGDATNNAMVEGGSNQPPKDQGGGRDRSERSDGIGVVHGESSSPEALTAKFTLWLVVATVVLALATLALAVSTIGLYRQTRRLADEAVNQGEKTERQIEISEKSATAATLAAQAAADSFAAERAWVMFSGLVTGSALESSFNDEYFQKACLLQIAWTNYGRSPAMGAKFHLEACIVDRGTVPDRFNIPDWHDNPGVAFPPGQQHMGGLKAISHEDILKIKSNQLDCYIYGASEYHNKEDQSVRRISEFCGMVSMIDIQVLPNGHCNYAINLMSWGPQNTAS